MSSKASHVISCRSCQQFDDPCRVPNTPSKMLSQTSNQSSCPTTSSFHRKHSLELAKSYLVLVVHREQGMRSLLLKRMALHAGREADITLLRDTLFSQKLAPCITSLNLLEQTDFVDADAFYSICSLSRLTYLSLNATFCDRAFEDQAIITSAVSRLTSLRVSMQACLAHSASGLVPLLDMGVKLLHIFAAYPYCCNACMCAGAFCVSN